MYPDEGDAICRSGSACQYETRSGLSGADRVYPHAIINLPDVLPERHGWHLPDGNARIDLGLRFKGSAA